MQATRTDFFIPGVYQVPVTKTQGRPIAPRTRKAYDLIKQHGYISLMSLCQLMGLGIGSTMTAVQNASIMEGSLIYEEVVDGRLCYGWLEVE